MSIWHVGDTHFGHNKVARYRGFFHEDGTANTAAHDAAVYRSIADRLQPGDTIRLYGDVTFDADWRQGLDIMQQLKAEHPAIRLELLYGNHDPIHPMHRHHTLEVYQEYAAVYDWMGERLHNKADYGRSVHFSHFPAVNGDDRHSDRYLLWQIPAEQLQFEGKDNATDWVVHGHTHQWTMINESRPNHICVSWDVLRGPVSDGTLKRAILRQLGKKRLSQPAHWGTWEQYRPWALDLQSMGK